MLLVQEIRVVEVELRGRPSLVPPLGFGLRIFRRPNGLMFMALIVRPCDATVSMFYFTYRCTCDRRPRDIRYTRWRRSRIRMVG